MKKNLISASIVGVGLLLWLLSGLFVDRPDTLADTSTAGLTVADDARFRVRATRFEAQQRVLTQILRGKTDTKRSAQVSAETAGRVVARPVERGQQVRTGDLLCELAVEDREARRAQETLEQ